MTEDYDVVVVGARPAGAATALLLARQGLRVLVLERAKPGADTLSTHALMRAGVAQLARWGLLDSIVAADTPAVRRTRFHYPGEQVTVSIKPAAGVEALYAPRRTLLDRLLAEAAENAGATVRYGVTVTGLDRDRSGRITGVVGHDHSSAPVRVRSWLTVGADGAGSTVARLVGAPNVRVGSASGAIIYGYWDGLGVTDYEWFYRPGASAGMIPTNDGKVCVFAGTSAQRFNREVSGDLWGSYMRLLAEATGPAAAGRLPESLAPRRLHGHPGRTSYLRQAHGAGWALVGDAGQFIDPLSSNGITDALRDADLLSRQVAAIVSGVGEIEALAAYQAERDQLATPIFDVVDELAGYRWDVPAVRELLLRLNSAFSAEVEALTGPIGAATIKR
ncbi:NAD(P)/FAD-dependent oxidoreductase [Micromonospora sp. NPDC047527]|uniref:NAD(P)/FAD-dependent oxidoreductase n=1 Tax=Micromonospora sp. NPDC047527 TaxID=3155144 RepID=UPI0033FAA74B